MAAIESLQRECTTVVVTHDMQMIPADAAVLFLAASTHPIHGNHAELTRTCPSYRAFLDGQSPATKNDQWPSGVMPTR